MNRQKMVLAILLALFAVSLVVSFLRQPRLKTVDRLKYTPGMKADVPRTAGKVPDDKKLRLDLLDRGAPRFSGFRRNIFQPIFSSKATGQIAMKPVLPVPPPPAPTPPALPPPPPPPPPTPGEQAMQEVAKFTFLGFLQKDNRKTIFLSKDNEIILVKKGDKIAGKYEVATITDDALTINLLSGGDQIVIPLVENKALGAGKGAEAGAPAEERVGTRRRRR